jgi:hypothetical protein
VSALGDDEKKIRVAGAVYDLADGRVTLVN